jgi:phage-related holin
MDRFVNFLIIHPRNILSGFIATSAAYFAPIRGMAIVTFVAIIIDLGFGLWAAREKKEPIESRKLWRTGYKIAIVFIIINLMHSIDTEMGIPGISTSQIVALFITGWEVWSILESAAIITDHPVFRALSKYMRTEVKEKTNVDFAEEKI